MAYYYSDSSSSSDSYYSDGGVNGEDYVRVDKGDYIIRFDGACRGNPGVGGAGAVAYRCVNNPYGYGKRLVQVMTKIRYESYVTTSNQMEYSGLICALDLCQKITRTDDWSYRNDFIFQGDSTVVIKQMRGEFAVRSPKLCRLNEIAQARLNRLDLDRGPWFEIIPRYKNMVADELANEAIDLKQNCTRRDCFEDELLPFFPEERADYL